VEDTEAYMKLTTSIRDASVNWFTFAGTDFLIFDAMRAVNQPEGGVVARA
jgi:hypothetical protein